MAQVIALALQLGYAPPQAMAIGHYAWQAAHLDRHFTLSSPLDPCAKSRLGEGIVDVVGNLRGDLHRFATTPGDRIAGPPPQAPHNACIPAEVQLRFLKEAFPLHYPACAAKFAAGDLGALERCWGRGHSQ